MVISWSKLSLSNVVHEGNVGLSREQEKCHVPSPGPGQALDGPSQALEAPGQA